MTPLVTQFSWTNHLLILLGCKTDEEREFYIRLCIKENYSKRQLGTVTLFPVVGVIYGESNGGKSTFLKMLSKLMCNAKIPLNATSDVTAKNIENLKRGCEGVPLNIDDLDRTQFQNHVGKIIKDDEWGIA